MAAFTMLVPAVKADSQFVTATNPTRTRRDRRTRRTRTRRGRR